MSTTNSALAIASLTALTPGVRTTEQIQNALEEAALLELEKEGRFRSFSQLEAFIKRNKNCSVSFDSRFTSWVSELIVYFDENHQKVLIDTETIKWTEAKNWSPEFIESKKAATISILNKFLDEGKENSLNLSGFKDMCASGNRIIIKKKSSAWGYHYWNLIAAEKEEFNVLKGGKRITEKIKILDSVREEDFFEVKHWIWA